MTDSRHSSQSQGAQSGVHVSVSGRGGGQDKADYHFSTLLALFLLAAIFAVGAGLGALIFGFEILSRI